MKNKKWVPKVKLEINKQQKRKRKKKKNKKNSFYWYKFPLDLIFECFKYLNWDDKIINCRLVCKKWRKYSKNFFSWDVSFIDTTDLNILIPGKVAIQGLNYDVPATRMTELKILKKYCDILLYTIGHNPFYMGGYKPIIVKIIHNDYNSEIEYNIENEEREMKINML